ncbi:ATP-dependent DNA helicase [Trichonephila clavipes]|nr:ATP-dependent DNA helicase [Trichonephila clavipes]
MPPKATTNWPIYTLSTKEVLQASESDEQQALRLENLQYTPRRPVRLNRLTNENTARSGMNTAHADLNLIAFHYDSNNDYNLHPNVVIGKMDKICMHCSALKFKMKSVECAAPVERVKLPELHSPPEPLSTFLSGVTRVSKHFLENIRKYNSCFQMTSFSATNIMR